MCPPPELPGLSAAHGATRDPLSVYYDKPCNNISQKYKVGTLRSGTAYGLTPSKQEPWHLSVRFSQFDTNIDIPAKKKSQLGICLHQVGP